MTTNLTDLFARIRDTLDESGPGLNLHDEALLVITMCIDAGVDTKPDLIRVLTKFGFNGGHIAHMLDDRKGPYRNSNYWRVDDGRYQLLDQAA